MDLLDTYKQVYEYLRTLATSYTIQHARKVSAVVGFCKGGPQLGVSPKRELHVL